MAALAATIVVLLAHLPATLPESILFHDSPATMAEMKAISGTWTNRLNKPSLTLTPRAPGWMKFTEHKGSFGYWPGHPQSYVVAVTTYNGQLFLNIPLRDIYPKGLDVKFEYQGQECYAPLAIRHIGLDVIDMLFLSDEMKAANPWYPTPLPQSASGPWECGDLVLRAHAAEKQRVVVILREPVPADEGPFRRIPTSRPRR